MKILLCSQTVITQELGAPRVLLGVAEGLESAGWECQVVGSDHIRAHLGPSFPPDASFSEALRSYLLDVADEFDVIDYPHGQLPFPRSDFSARPLFVARSVLLEHHFPRAEIPKAMLPHQRLKHWLTGDDRRGSRATAETIAQANVTLAQADLINVANDDDKAVLVEEGLPPERIAVIPYGMGANEFALLDGINRTPPVKPRLCFLGTFDNRKGGADLPRLFAQVCERVPDCELRLIGTAGQHPTASRVFAFFPRSLCERIEVVPRFGRSELPRLLDGCSAGIFPSYVEGFGFAVLEMMAAGLPVAAYRSPGPPMMLSDEFLVPRGDVSAMVELVVSWLTREPLREALAAQARERAGYFTLEEVGRLTDARYRQAIAAR